MTRYPYTDRDLMRQREDYFYSALHGPGFLAAYRDARLRILADLPDMPARPTAEPVPYPAAGARIDTAALLAAIEAAPDPDWIDRLVQRFEVTKRIFRSYDGPLRRGDGGSDDLALYARLASVLAGNAAGQDRLPWLNALLKLNDLLCSQPADRRSEIAGTLRRTIPAEMAAIEALPHVRRGPQDA